MTPEAKKHCEELANSELIYDDYLKKHYLKTIRANFEKGFQAGYSYNEEKLRVALEALLWCQKKSAHMKSEHAGEINRKTTEALAKIRGEE